MLQIEEISKVFGATRAVDNVTLSIAKPAMIGVIGASGAGKSTLLRMLNLLERPTTGRITYEGRCISDLRSSQARGWQADCAMIFQ